MRNVDSNTLVRKPAFLWEKLPRGDNKPKTNSTSAARSGTGKPMLLKSVFGGRFNKMNAAKNKNIQTENTGLHSTSKTTTTGTTSCASWDHTGLPQDAMVHILSFLPLHQVVRVRTLSKSLAQAGQLTVLQKLQKGGFLNLTCPSDALLALEKPSLRARHWLYSEFQRATTVIRQSNNVHKRNGAAVEIRQFPIVPQTETYQRVQTLLLQPMLHAKYLWMLETDQDGQDHGVGLDFRSSCLRVCVSVEKCIQEYRATLEEAPTLLSFGSARCLDIMLRKELETLLALQAGGHDMACVYFVSKPARPDAMEGSIYETVAKALEEPLMSHAINIEGKKVLQHPSLSPCFLDLSHVGFAMRVPCLEIQPLFQRFDTMAKEHSRQKIVDLLQM
ncbi:expressed unknown protein [Seminavis robusta]|uniref:F-box domain-containing protein n=1 Tax=Seminavis robusta TaxID=568900 RepID=A0A9N8D9A2_9STRA|nr:expressed unknown protein [Seminavis robusta]|eukprot:Sro7_g005750.1 n/a (389) ;mRNA; r:19185-20351